MTGEPSGFISRDLDRYASGEISISEIECVVCGVAPCDCPPFGPAYFDLLDRLHGRKPSLGSGAE